MPPSNDVIHWMLSIIYVIIYHLFRVNNVFRVHVVLDIRHRKVSVSICQLIPSMCHLNSLLSISKDVDQFWSNPLNKILFITSV